MTLDGAALTYSVEGSVYTANTGALANGTHTVVIKATSVNNIVSTENITIKAGDEITVTEIGAAKKGASISDSNTKWNGNIYGGEYLYFAFDADGLDAYKLNLTTSDVLRPVITAAEDYSYVRPDTAKNYEFTITDTRGLNSVSIMLDNEAVSADESNGSYSFSKTLTKGVHTLVVTAENTKGVKSVYETEIIAKDYEVMNNAITLTETGAEADCDIMSYLGNLQGAVVVLAAYDSDNGLLDFDYRPYTITDIKTEAYAELTTIPANTDTLKLMVWRDIAGMQPLCDVIEYKITSATPEE